tara:strand:+ start:1143 stop:1940 length:798 start_codon:yes stop_codon:yes gene_type:complete
MRSPRLIAVVYLKNEIVVQSENFSKFYPIGSLKKTLEYLNNWGIDEIIILSIDGKYNHTQLKNSIREIHLPITFGGNVRNTNDIKKLLDIGIDKISFNQLLRQNPKKILEFSKIYGNQFIVGSIDIKKNGNYYFEYDYKNKKVLNENIIKKIKSYQEYGIGEFFINFVDKDGLGKNLDLKLSKKIASSISTPLIVCGGAKDINKIIQFYKLTSANPAIGNLFHHFENSARLIKEQLFSEFKEIRDPEYKYYKLNNLEKILGRNEN